VVSDEEQWNFSYEGPLHDSFPALQAAQSAWLSEIESVQALDRKTHELIRMVCVLVLRNGAGVQRHAQIAAELGATWDEIVGTIVLTQPAIGILPAAEMLPFARTGFEAAEPTEED
jgi:alkylhydroperoxidase/carboxymuconolactone decarboxylase family protein YurZ